MLNSFSVKTPLKSLVDSIYFPVESPLWDVFFDKFKPWRYDQFDSDYYLSIRGDIYSGVYGEAVSVCEPIYRVIIQLNYFNTKEYGQHALF